VHLYSEKPLVGRDHTIGKVEKREPSVEDKKFDGFIEIACFY
jgi:hypothetical protein